MRRSVLFSGYLIGSVLGVFLGAVIGENETGREIFNPIANFIRSIPSAAKVPVIMAILGIGTATRVTAVSLAVMFPVFMATMRAVAVTDEKLLELSKLMGYGRIRSLVMIRVTCRYR
ncbi:MAG: ABC transporter permease subunit [Actinomycetota bacterium]